MDSRIKSTKLLCFLVMMASSPLWAYSGGAGEPNDPYQIATPGDLIQLGGTPSDFDKSFVLVADVNLSEYVFEEAVIAIAMPDEWGGYNGNPFSGQFDGQGYVIRNLRIENANAGVGLFGYLSKEAKITRLGLEDVFIEGKIPVEWDDYGCVGGLAGYNIGGSIVSCYTTGKIAAGKFALGSTKLSNEKEILRRIIPSIPRDIYDTAVGGLVGLNLTGVIESCYSNATVLGGETYSGSRDCFVGGLVGRNDGGNLLKSYTCSSVSGNDNVGGLVGENSDGNIEFCYSTATVLGEEAIGGLVGTNDGGSLLKSYTCGSVSGNDNVGGLVGENSEGDIEFCYSKASVFGDMAIGGLIGTNERGNLYCCFSMGIVRGEINVGGLAGLSKGRIENCQSYSLCSGNYYVGGLVGAEDLLAWDVEFEIHNCLSVGAVYGDAIYGGWETVGGLVGEVTDGLISNSLWNVESSICWAACGEESWGVDLDNVHGMTTSELLDMSTYLSLGWDFVDEVNNGLNDYWQSPNNAYPVLSLLAEAYPSEPNGLGTSLSPYIINTVTELQSVSYRPIAHYQLGTGLDFNDVNMFTSIIPWFGGHFDGNGLSVENLCIHGERYWDRYLGLFDVLGPNAVLENLSVKNVMIESDGEYAAGLVVRNGGRISRCSSSGNVKARSKVGGLAALNWGKISNTWSDVAVEGEDYVGGLVGWGFVSWGDESSTVMASYSAGDVNASGDFVGGLIGCNEDSSITSSFWDIEVTGQESSEGGVGLSTAEMQNVNNYLNAGWDFVDETLNGTEDIWFLPEKDYPLFSWEIN